MTNAPVRANLRGFMAKKKKNKIALPEGKGPLGSVGSLLSRHFADVAESLPYLQRLGAYVLPYKWRLVAGVILGSLYGSWVAALLPALKKTFEFFEAKKINFEFPELAGIAVLVPVYFLVRGVLGYLSSYLNLWVGMRVVLDLKIDLYDHLQKLSLDYFSNQKSGRLIFQVLQRTKTAQNALTRIVHDVVSAPMTIITVILLMSRTDLFFTAIALSFVPISIIPAVILGFLVRASGKSEEHAGAGTANLLQETLAGIRTVKSYARGEDESKRFQKEAYREYGHSIRNRKYLEMVGPCVEILGSFGFAAAIIYGLVSKMQISTLLMLAAGLFMLYEPFKRMSKLYVTLQRISVMAEAMMGLLDVKPSITNKPDARVLQEATGLIEFKNVTFTYIVKDTEHLDNLDAAPVEVERRVALRDVSLTFEPGKFYALVGPSGAGKSTIASLILRFWDPQQGQVLVDGHDVRDLDFNSLRRQIGFVPQEVFLFHDTIMANILYGRPGASSEAVTTAAKRAYADEFIQMLPREYETVVGDKGCRFSGGQQQRLSLARAFLKNAPVLLLDEATSALDAESASKVQIAIDKFAKGRTVIAIAHRLSTIERADQIIVMEKGRVAGVGTHQELLANSPLYQRLCALQFGVVKEEV